MPSQRIHSNDNVIIVLVNLYFAAGNFWSLNTFHKGQIMEAAVSVVRKTEIDQVVEGLHSLLAVLDQHELHMPAIHVASAIDCLERSED